MKTSVSVKLLNQCNSESEKLLPSSKSSSKLVSVRRGRRDPLNMLLDKVRDFKFFILLRVYGISPRNALFEISKNVKLLMLPTKAVKLPPKLFFDKRKARSAESFSQPIVLKLPFNLLMAKLRKLSFCNFVIDCGIGPVRFKFESPRYVAFSHVDICSSVPTMPSFPSSPIFLIRLLL